MNRWTGPLRQQQETRVFLTPTSPISRSRHENRPDRAQGPRESVTRRWPRIDRRSVRGRGEVRRVPRAGFSVRPGRRVGRSGALAGRLVPGGQIAAKLDPPAGQLSEERTSEDRPSARPPHQGEPTSQAEGETRVGLGHAHDQAWYALACARATPGSRASPTMQSSRLIERPTRTSHPPNVLRLLSRAHS